LELIAIFYTISYVRMSYLFISRLVLVNYSLVTSVRCDRIVKMAVCGSRRSPGDVTLRQPRLLEPLSTQSLVAVPPTVPRDARRDSLTFEGLIVNFDLFEMFVRCEREREKINLHV
jgi:hypothetical protein